MLEVKTPEEVYALLDGLTMARLSTQQVPIEEAAGRILAEPLISHEFVPDFDRSTVDGYVVKASDTFGCSAAIPAILPVAGEILMGSAPAGNLQPGQCMAIPTGGELPEGADAVVMVEYTQDYGDNTIGIEKSVAPGTNVIFRGDDVRPGKTVLPAGHLLLPQDIGSMAAMGITQVRVFRKPVVGILSTGDELVPVSDKPAKGQIRDVNSIMLRAIMQTAGADVISYGIIRDDEAALDDTLSQALAACDMVLISGGTSVGEKDAAAAVISAHGRLLFHGIAMKPGKPTIFAMAGEKPVFGLPGHPVAAFFICHLFVKYLLARMSGRKVRPFSIKAVLCEPVSANHGRAQYGVVRLESRDGMWAAHPVRSKSGLITTLAGAEGWFCIPRDREGAAAGEMIDVWMFSAD